MNDKNLKLAQNIVNKSYIDLAQNSLQSRENLINTLLSQRSLPEYGWDDLTIEYFLNNLAAMDTNNFPGKIGVGERESRIFSSIVQKRNFYMGHGIGRSGDIAAIQPKAAGSSLVLKLGKFLTKDALKVMGVQQVEDLLLMPLATGMSLSTVLLAFQSQKPNAKYVIWSRIDQKTCLKCIKTVNLQPVVIEGKIIGDEICTDLEEIENKIKELGKENILCVLSTTSCFAPRTPDDVEGIGKLCQQYDINHLINNAYGLQCSKIVNQLNMANANGRVDAVVQSTDKNFMVPVGGSIIFSFSKKNNNSKKVSQETLKGMSPEEKKQFYTNLNQNNQNQKNIIDKISELYPGRASAAPIMDLFITLLSMGKNGLQKLLKDRKDNLVYAKQQIAKFTQKYNEKLLNTPRNTISLGITLKNYSQFCEDNSDQIDKEKEDGDSQQIQQMMNQVQDNSEASQLGAFLYSKRVMGSRILTTKPGKKVCGIEFKNYGSNSENYPNLPYITCAIAIGMERQEVDIFLEKLSECLKEFGKKQDKMQTKEENNNKQQQQQ